MKNEADVAATKDRQCPTRKLRDVTVADDDLALIGRLQTADQIEQRCFSAAGCADDRDKFALRRRQIHACERLYPILVLTITFADLYHLKDRHLEHPFL